MDSEPIDLLAQRRMCHDFRWASRTWTNMPYFVRGEQKNPKEIIVAVMESQNIQKVVRELSKDKNVKEADIRKEAKETLVELAHDYHLYAIRWFGVVLSKLGKRLYNSIQVDTARLEEIKRAYSSYPVLLLPTHRSYVDFLLVSYLSFSFDLTLPIIAAGMDFKGMVGVGELLRKSGAFYIRRRFGGDPLYWALISEYVKIAMLEGGHPLEMFVEGTRSRTGKSLKPKIGLLSIITELVTSGQIPNILILPISMSYDRTLEERLYAHELLGQPKPKESTNGLMKALKWLGCQSYGSVYVNFGNLMSIREMMDRTTSVTPSIRPELSLKSVQSIALNVVLDHQANLAVPIIAGIAVIVVSEISRESMFSMSLGSLLRILEFLEFILKSRNTRFGYPIRGESLEVNVRFILNVHSSLLSINSSPNDGRNYIVEAKLEAGSGNGEIAVQHMVFQHYANQILSSIFPLSIISLLQHQPNQHVTEESELDSQQNPNQEAEFGSKMKLQISEIQQDYYFMRELFQEDFLYAESSISQELEWALTLYNSWRENLESAGWNSAMNGDAPGICRNLLRHALEPYIIPYWGVIRKLEDAVLANSLSRFEVKEFGKTCQDFLSERMKSGEIVKAYGSLSLETISNAIGFLVRVSALDRFKMENGSFGIVVRDSSRLASISNCLDRLVGWDWRSRNMEKHSGMGEKSEENSKGMEAGVDQVGFVLRSKL